MLELRLGIVAQVVKNDPNPVLIDGYPLFLDLLELNLGQTPIILEVPVVENTARNVGEFGLLEAELGATPNLPAHLILDLLKPDFLLLRLVFLWRWSGSELLVGQKGPSSNRHVGRDNGFFHFFLGFRVVTTAFGGLGSLLGVSSDFSHLVVLFL